MVERLRKEQYAELLVTAFMGVVEFEELEPAEQRQYAAQMAGAIDALEQQGHIIVPASLIAANTP